VTWRGPPPARQRSASNPAGWRHAGKLGLAQANSCCCCCRFPQPGDALSWCPPGGRRRLNCSRPAALACGDIAGAGAFEAPAGRPAASGWRPVRWLPAQRRTLGRFLFCRRDLALRQSQGREFGGCLRGVPQVVGYRVSRPHSLGRPPSFFHFRVDHNLTVNWCSSERLVPGLLRTASVRGGGGGRRCHSWNPGQRASGSGWLPRLRKCLGERVSPPGRPTEILGPSAETRTRKSRRPPLPPELTALQDDRKPSPHQSEGRHDE